MTIFWFVVFHVLSFMGAVENFSDAALAMSKGFAELEDADEVIDMIKRVMKAICRGLYIDHLLPRGYEKADVWAAINAVPIDKQRTLSYLKGCTISVQDCMSILNRAQIAIAEMTIWGNEMSADFEKDPSIKTFSHVGEDYAIRLYQMFLAPLLAFLGISFEEDVIREAYVVYALKSMCKNAPVYCLTSFVEDGEGGIYDIHRSCNVSDEVADIVRRLNEANAEKTKDKRRFENLLFGNE